MDRTLSGSMLQPGTNLARNIKQVPDRKPFFARQHSGNAVALDVLHGRAELAVDFARTVKQDYVLTDEVSRALAFSDQRVYKRVGAVAKRLQVLCLERYDLVSFRIQCL